MARLSVAVLGPPEVRHGHQILAFPTRKTLAFLVYLLVEGRSQPRDKLTAFFWPESGEDAGRATLRSTLARLREGLGGTAAETHLIIERENIGFDFASDFDLDLQRLEAAHGLARTLAGGEHLLGEARRTVIARLQRGADAWRGEFLEAFALRGAPDFDDWAALQREVWRQRMETVLDRLSLLHANAGTNVDAIEIVNRWLLLSPLEERAHRRLMRLRLAAGDRPGALRAYETCRAALDRELGVRPDPETEAIVARIRAGPSRPASSHRSRAPNLLPPLVEMPLVGRADEFTKLVKLYHAAGQGRPQVAVLQGEAGIGKTRLATEFLGWAAAQGADAVHGCAFETGVHLPYQPLIDALRPRLEGVRKLESLLSDTWLVELSRLLPELRERRPALPMPAGDEEAARARLFEALSRLGQALAAEASLVLCVDDVQWADAASLDVLRYAGRRWAREGTSVLLLLGLRSEALASSPPIEEWLLGLSRDLATEQLDLGPLTFEDTLRLLHGPGAEPALAPALDELGRWIFAETGGQPFFMMETLRALLSQGTLAPRRVAGGWAIEVVQLADLGGGRALLPPGVRRIIHARLVPLTQTARDLLVAAAVLGQGRSFELLCQVGGIAADNALPALDEVLRGHMLREAGDGGGKSGEEQYVFVHDKIRDVVHAEAGEARLRIFHRHALAALEAANAPAAELARHALEAGLDASALRYSMVAGDDAVRLLAARVAVAHYERALVLAERLGCDDLLAELHARRGRAFILMAMWAEARRELEAAYAGFAGDGRERRAEILADLAEACWWLLDVPAAHRHATEALALATELGRGDLELKAVAWLAAVDGAAGDLRTSVERNRRAIGRARELGVAPPGVAHLYGALALYWLGQPDAAVEGNREAMTAARDAGDIHWSLWSLSNLGIALAATGRYDEGARAFDAARRLGRDYGVDNLLSRAIAMSAGFHLDLFDFAGAEARSLEARELAHALNFQPAAVSAGIDLLLNYARRQEIGRTEHLVAEVAAAAAQTAGFHGWLWKLRLAEARAELALARGDRREALRWANEAIGRSRARGRVKYEVIGLTTRASALIGLNRTGEAMADLHAAVTVARPVGDPALLLRPIAGLLSLNGNDALAAEGSAAIERIVGALPDAEMRRRFVEAEPLRAITRHTSPAIKEGNLLGRD